MESEKLTAVSERPDEVLKVWDVESSHKYENNQHNSQVQITVAGTVWRTNLYVMYGKSGKVAWLNETTSGIRHIGDNTRMNIRFQEDIVTDKTSIPFVASLLSRVR